VVLHQAKSSVDQRDDISAPLAHEQTASASLTVFMMAPQKAGSSAFGRVCMFLYGNHEWHQHQHRD
jgi:hypothetical protein